MDGRCSPRCSCAERNCRLSPLSGHREKWHVGSGQARAEAGRQHRNAAHGNQEVKAPVDFSQSLRGVSQSLGLSRHAVGKLVELGFVAPVKARGKAWKFSFQDLVLLRSAHELRAARIPTRQILQALRQLRATLPEAQPLQGMRITAEGDRVTVRWGDARWEPQTGQFVLDLQIASGDDSTLRFFSRPHAPIVDAAALDARFAEAQALEESSPEAAEALYRRILKNDPSYAHAYLNLGFMLCESGRCEARRALTCAKLKKVSLSCDEPVVVHLHVRRVHESPCAPCPGVGRSSPIRASSVYLVAQQEAVCLHAEIGIALEYPANSFSNAACPAPLRRGRAPETSSRARAAQELPGDRGKAMPRRSGRQWRQYPVGSVQT
jgi:hypothetical protein